ncbi:MAG: hypothetical protein ACTILD_04230, partial [Pseudoalteromonas sp.]
MPLMRWLNIVLFSFFLAACGGGGSLEKEGGSLDGNTGDTEVEVVEQSLQVELDFEDRIVTADAPLEITATVTGSDGLPIS